MMACDKPSDDPDAVILKVRVEDTGIGIRPEEMHKLYSAFDRLDFEKTRNIEGSGLGLAITQNLLALMGSQIQVESEYGKGSTFSFVLKQGIADENPIGTFESSGSQVEKYKRRHHRATFTAPEARLLIVDDTPMNLQVICGMLKENTLIIDTANSGEECIAFMRENKYDVVFLDQRMPNMDGVETLRRMNMMDHKCVGTPVIMLTANAMSDAKDFYLKQGFNDFIAKPITEQSICGMLERYLPADLVHRGDNDGI